MREEVLSPCSCTRFKEQIRKWFHWEHVTIFARRLCQFRSFSNVKKPSRRNKTILFPIIVKDCLIWQVSRKVRRRGNANWFSQRRTIMRSSWKFNNWTICSSSRNISTRISLRKLTTGRWNCKMNWKNGNFSFRNSKNKCPKCNWSIELKWNRSKMLRRIASTGEKRRIERRKSGSERKTRSRGKLTARTIVRTWNKKTSASPRQLEDILNRKSCFSSAWFTQTLKLSLTSRVFSLSTRIRLLQLLSRKHWRTEQFWRCHSTGFLSTWTWQSSDSFFLANGESTVSTSSSPMKILPKKTQTWSNDRRSPHGSTPLSSISKCRPFFHDRPHIWFQFASTISSISHWWHRERSPSSTGTSHLRCSMNFIRHITKHSPARAPLWTSRTRPSWPTPSGRIRSVRVTLWAKHGSNPSIWRTEANSWSPISGRQLLLKWVTNSSMICPSDPRLCSLHWLLICVECRKRFCSNLWMGSIVVSWSPFNSLAKRRWSRKWMRLFKWSKRWHRCKWCPPCVCYKWCTDPMRWCPVWAPMHSFGLAQRTHFSTQLFITLVTVRRTMPTVQVALTATP